MMAIMIILVRRLRVELLQYSEQGLFVCTGLRYLRSFDQEHGFLGQRSAHTALLRGMDTPPNNRHTCEPQ